MQNLDIGEYIEKYNPFMFKDCKNRIEYFESYKEVYAKTIKYIVEDCPKGYFDLAVFMKKHCGMDDASAIEYATIAQKTYRLFLLNKIVCIDVTNLRSEVSTFQTIMQALHLITETPFDPMAFEVAFGEYLNSKKYEKDEENDS